MIDVQTLAKIYADKLLATGSHDRAFLKAVWMAYKAGYADGSARFELAPPRPGWLPEDDEATKNGWQMPAAGAPAGQ